MYVGIDVGGTNLKAGLTDESGKILAVRRIPLGEFRGSGPWETLAELTKARARDGGSSRDFGIFRYGISRAVAEETALHCNIPLEIPGGRAVSAGLPVPVILAR